MPAIKRILLSILAIILIFEEWLWEILTVFGNHLSKLLHLQKFEFWLSEAPPAVALIAFVIPVIIVAPISFIGLVLMVHGCFLRGVMVEIFGKLLGTLLVARIFKLTKKQLLTFRYFAFVYNKIMEWLYWAHKRITSTMTYRLARQLQDKIMQSFRR